jgi:hypothetical protein
MDLDELNASLSESVQVSDQATAQLATYFSDVFGLDPSVLEEYGAFNVSLISDLPLFIDPFLLFNSAKPDYQALHDSMIGYLRFLRDKAVNGLVTDGLLHAWFMFGEVKQNWLGFSILGNDGRGLGLDFAKSLLNNLNTIFSSFGAEQTTKGSHLEKLTLIRDGVGRDNISDFTTNLIKDFLLRYTEDFARQYLSPTQRRVVAVEKVAFNYKTESWQTGKYELPYFNGDYVILTPKDLLTRDDTWINRKELIGDIDDIAAALPDEALRDQVNNYLYGQLSPKATEEEIRTARADTLEQFPQLIEQYIKLKEDSGDDALSVSRDRVQQTERLFIDEVRVLRTALYHASAFYGIEPNTFDEARSRVMYLKDVIENQDGYRAFYRDGQLITQEKHLQIFYLLTWFGTAADVNREVNNGRGPVDFKISKGALDRTVIEFKLASNKKLKQNLEHQVEIYQAANKPSKALTVITFFSENEETRVKGILKELNRDSDPNVILIDGRNDNKPSASVA